METRNKKLIYLSITTTEETFTIGGRGKFQQDLTKEEAVYLYIKLHDWLIKKR